MREPLNAVMLNDAVPRNEAMRQKRCIHTHRQKKFLKTCHQRSLVFQTLLYPTLHSWNVYHNYRLSMSKKCIAA